jgi:hypothetical protein
LELHQTEFLKAKGTNMKQETRAALGAAKTFHMEAADALQWAIDADAPLESVPAQEKHSHGWD